MDSPIMASKFKIGDIVLLKSGSPLMTANSLGPVKNFGPAKNLGPNTVFTTWFAGKKHETGMFSEDSLILAPPMDEEK
jgi:uncharacterized protein YodC (DUF2158 family)